MNQDLLKKLKNAGLLSEALPDLGYVSTGSYALNKIISGNYTDGVPIGMITQFIGESSTAKTVFGTHVLKEAQAKGYYTMMVDSENSYNPDFAKQLGIDPKELIYSAPETLEDSFQVIEDTILAIRETDTDTPIVVVYDSIAVSPPKAEYEAESYDGNNMQGAIRAKIAGACLRKINPVMRKYKVALVVINQIRHKVGVMYGSPETPAAGGKALDFYLDVNLKCISNKTSDLIKDENKVVVGIQGKLRNTKNKCSVPFKECDFELLFDEGINPYAGLIKHLEHDEVIKRTGPMYTICETGRKFYSKNFVDDLKNKEEVEYDPIRKLLEI